MLNLKSLACVFIIVSCVEGSFSQTPVPPPSPRQLWTDGQRVGVLGDYLETIFEQQLGTCLKQQGTPKKLTVALNGKPRTTAQVSAIPLALINADLRQNRKALLASQSIGRAFAYVYPTPHMDVVAPAPGMFLQSTSTNDYLESAQFLLAQGFNNAVYDYSCSSSLAASIQANASWSFVPADVSTAISADLNSQGTYHLVLVSGTFQTNMWKQLNSTGDDAWLNLSRFLIWNWYQNRPDETRSTANRFLLSQFNGVSVYKLTTGSFSKDGQASLNASVGVGGLSLKGALSADYKDKTQISVEEFATLVREHPLVDGTEDDQFDPFPKPADLALAITSSTRAHTEGTNSSQVLRRVTQHTQLVHGMPASVCTREWKVEPVGAIAGNFTVKGTDVRDASPSTCSLLVTYDMGSDPTPTSRVDLDYSLVSDVKDSAGVTVATAKLKADKISLSSSGKPYLQATGPITPVANTQTVSGVDFYTFDWASSLPVVEDIAATEKVQYVAPDVMDAKITCATNRVISMQTAGATYTPGVLRLSLHLGTDQTVEKLDATHLTVPCTLSGRVVFSLVNGSTVTADLPHNIIFYPPVTPIAVAQPPVVVAPILPGH